VTHALCQVHGEHNSSGVGMSDDDIEGV